MASTLILLDPVDNRMLRRSWARLQAASRGGRFRGPRTEGITSTGQAHGKIHKIKHYQMLFMVAACGGGGYLAGRWAPFDDDEVCKPTFDKDAIKDQMKSSFEFRPDLAATTIRAAFVLAARRAGVDARFIGDSCSTKDGLRDVANVLQFQTMGSNGVSTEDLTVLAAIEAIRFLRGPADDIEFRWGRHDEVDTAKLIAEQNAEEQAARAQGEIVYSGKYVKTAEAPKVERSVRDVLAKLHPELTDAEMVALMACHGIGEYHFDVSGIEDCPSRLGLNKSNLHTLDNHYFKLLLQFDKDWKPWEIPRTSENRSMALPSMVKAFATVPVKGKAEGDKAKTKKRMLVITQREMEALLKEKPKMVTKAELGKDGKPNGKKKVVPQHEEWRTHVEAFAKDNDLFRKNFASGFQKLIEGNCKHRLRRYVPRSQFIEAHKLAEKEAIEREEKQKAAADAAEAAAAALA